MTSSSWIWQLIAYSYCVAIINNRKNKPTNPRKKLTLTLCSLILISCGDEKNTPLTGTQMLTQKQNNTLEKIRIESNQRLNAEIQKEIAVGRSDLIQARRLKLNIMLNNGEITLEQLKKAEQALEAESKNQPATQL